MIDFFLSHIIHVRTQILLWTGSLRTIEKCRHPVWQYNGRQMLVSYCHKVNNWLRVLNTSVQHVSWTWFIQRKLIDL